ncbi:hypothetical protein BDD12DRAFT_810182 [Trichophaea hybrida]|nr:hypothetical protein BDD12DRAFT_810182 [Trichophaea hybrida]
MTYSKNRSNISKSQAQAIVNYWRDNSEVKPSPRLGRSPILNERDKRRLRLISDAHPRMTLAEITNEARLPVKPRTTGDYLRAMNRWTFLARHEVRLQVGAGTGWRRKVRRTPGRAAGTKGSRWEFRHLTGSPGGGGDTGPVIL